MRRIDHQLLALGQPLLIGDTDIPMRRLVTAGIVGAILWMLICAGVWLLVWGHA